MLGHGKDAQNTVWRSRKLLAHVNRYDFRIINVGVSLVFRDARKMDVIDVTLCSTDVLHRVKILKVMDRLTMPDHRAIQGEIRHRRKRRNINKSRRNPKNKDRSKHENH